MMLSPSALLVVMLAMAPIANSHMIMAKPVPYGAPNSSPLDPSGSDFPCKAVPYTGTPNAWAVGSKQQLEFKGSAVHGGGSCQVSVCTDKEPTKTSKWKVIFSIEGGCPPPPPEGGNFAADPTKAGGGFEFTVPSELPNGDLAMAWTWFNKGGNREMYMNCAPVTVTGGSSDKTAFESLPDMAIANIQGQGTCKTTETFDYTFANPGKYTIKGGKGPYQALCGAGTGAPDAPASPANPGVPSQAPVAPQPVSPGVSSQAPSANPGVPTPSQVAVSSSNDKITSTARQVITVTAPSSPGPTSKEACSKHGPGAVSTPAVLIPSSQPSQAPAASQAPVKSQAPASPVPSSAAPPAGQACSPDGSIVCSADGQQLAICNWGKAVFQPVAQGTTCQGGKVAKRADYGVTLRTVYI